MKKIVNIHEAKTHLSRLVERAASGEEIVIAKAGKPMARLIAVESAGVDRRLGQLQGAVTESPDWWLPDAEDERLFYGPDEAPDKRIAERDSEP